MLGLCRKLLGDSTYKTFLPSPFIGCSKTSLRQYCSSVASRCYRICNSPAPLILLSTWAKLWLRIQVKKVFTMSWKRKEGLRQNWSTIKYIKLTTLRWGSLFSYVFPSVPSVHESRKFYLKPIRFDYTSYHPNRTFSIKPIPYLYYSFSMRF